MTNQSKITIGTIIGVIALGLILVYAKPPATSSPQSQDKENILEVDKTLHDFGTISMKNGKASTTFKVKNSLSGPVKLTKLYTSCMCTEATLRLNGRTKGPFGMLGHGMIPTFSESLVLNEEAEIEVVFDPNAHGPAGVGNIERIVTLEGEQGQLAAVTIKANVIP